MNLLLTLLLVPAALALVLVLTRYLTGGILPDRAADLEFIRSYAARKEADQR